MSHQICMEEAIAQAIVKSNDCQNSVFSSLYIRATTLAPSSSCQKYIYYSALVFEMSSSVSTEVCRQNSTVYIRK